MSNMMIQKKHFLLLGGIPFLDIFGRMYDAQKYIEAKNTNMSNFRNRLELTHTKRLKQFVPLKMLHLWKKTFYEEAKLWRYAAQKEVFVCRGKEKIEANIVLKLCEYKGYSAIYAVIDYGFENSDVWEQTSEAWLNIKNSQTPEALPEATLGVTVTGKGLPDPILTVCSFYPDIFDLQYLKRNILR